MILSSLLLTFNIIFTPVPGAASHTCTAYERHSVQGHPETNANGNIIGTGAYLIPSPWTSVTCTVIGPLPSDTTIQYAQISNSAADPNLPGLQVIACIKAVDAYGVTSACVDALDYVPTSLTKPLLGGVTSAPVANASTQ